MQFNCAHRLIKRKATKLSICLQRKVRKFIQSLLSTDDTAAIVKYSEYVIKVQNNFVVLEDDALTNAAQRPQCLTKTQQFFHRGKPRSDDSRFYTNMHILHTVEIRDVIGDLKYDLEIEGSDLGLQRMQHHGVVQVGHIFCMMDRIDTHEWPDQLQKILLQVLKCKPKMSLQACKINDRSKNKDANDLKF